jgi:alkanesulfonate monooxygenase SsuD/methylene tetrahydromethanopterin reductase-like flavin-dependent oxidoreductase (luciferase family)
MLHLGYKLSSEEFGPADLVRQAARAEAAGFDFALISDHFHPWTDRQGQSPSGASSAPLPARPSGSGSERA